MTNKFSLKDILRFVVPSTLGVLIFLTLVFVDGRPTIGMGIIFDLLRGVTQNYLPGFVTVLLESTIRTAIRTKVRALSESFFCR